MEKKTQLRSRSTGIGYLDVVVRQQLVRPFYNRAHSEVCHDATIRGIQPVHLWFPCLFLLVGYLPMDPGSTGVQRSSSSVEVPRAENPGGVRNGVDSCPTHCESQTPLLCGQQFAFFVWVRGPVHASHRRTADSAAAQRLGPVRICLSVSARSQTPSH